MKAISKAPSLMMRIEHQRFAAATARHEVGIDRVDGDQVGKELAEFAHGIGFALYGAGALLMPPLIGWIMDIIEHKLQQGSAVWSASEQIQDMNLDLRASAFALYSAALLPGAVA